MNYEGEFLSVHSIPGQVYAIEYIPELQSVAAVNVSDMEKPAALMILDPKSGKIVDIMILDPKSGEVLDIKISGPKSGEIVDIMILDPNLVRF